MNAKDLISQISEKTGVDADICAKVMKAFEEFSSDSSNSGNPLGSIGSIGSTLLGKLSGGKDDSNNKAMLENIVKKTGISKDICEKVLKVIEDVIGKGGKDILSKINPFK